MKSLILVVLFALGTTCIFAQAKRQNRGNKKPAITRSPVPQQGNKNETAKNPAIDSFKRSNRYTPGRPYEALEVATTPNSASDSGTINNATNRTATGYGGTTNQPAQQQRMNTTLNNNANYHNSRQAGAPMSPSHEPNRADVNQRPVNENSKNAIADMNSPQVNALNQNQMAPPPQNWGNNTSADNKWGRNTVGESQWTPTATISSSFNRDFPNITGATWVRDVRDTMNYSARYKTGEAWTTSTYNSTGARLSTRTELPLTNLPRAVALFQERQGRTNVRIQQVSRVERPSMAEVYEVVYNNGKVAYLNDLGMEESF